MTGYDVAAEAMSWAGTPFAHQASLRGVGCDCGGLVRGVAVALGCIGQAEFDRAFAPFAGYPRQPNGTLQAICDTFMARVPFADIGDAVLMNYADIGEPHHLAFVVDYPADAALGLVHALARPGRVVYHRFSAEFRARVVQAYRLPGVA